MATLRSFNGEHGRDRTCDLELRRLSLYPTELRARNHRKTSSILTDFAKNIKSNLHQISNRN